MNTRRLIELSGSGWRLWRDEAAAWEHDTLHLPPVDLTTLPVNPPTGGWDVLDGAGLAVTVPGTVEEHCWDEIGDYRGVSWWWRTFNVPAEGAGKRVLLCFDAVRMRAEVFLDRRLVGYDLVGQTPFQVDITDFVRPGEDHHLAVRITDPAGNFSWEDVHVDRWGEYTLPPSHGFGGIIGPVRLLIVDPMYIADVFVKNTPAITTVDLDITVRNTTDAPRRGSLRIQMLDADNPQHVVHDETLPDTEFQPGERTITHSVSVPGARQWSPDSPHLYLFHIALDECDHATARFGFRWFAPEGIGQHALLRLNGRRIVLRSAISWGFWPRSGMVPTPELIDKQVRAARQLGLNMLNAHRAMNHPMMLDRADELGLLVYEEPGGYRCLGGDEFAFRWARAQLMRMIRRDRNHPALIIYNLVNEHTDAPHLWHEQDLVDAHQLDPTRTITYTSGWSRSGEDDPIKLHLRPYDERLYIFGWADHHHAAGPGVQCDEFYQGPDNYRLHTANAAEIVFLGEEGAIGTPPRLELIHKTLQTQSNGWDGADYRDWYDAYARAWESKDWRRGFASIDDVTRSCGNIAFYYQGRTIENARLGNLTDGYVVNGWEAEKQENHSGIVDCFRNFKGDPEILAHYNQPLFVAVKLRQKVARCPATVTADFYLINEVDLKGECVLHASLKDEAGNTCWSAQHAVRVTGGDTFGELLLAGINVNVADGPGRYTLHAALRRGPDELATGHDELFLVDWNADELPLNGALLGDGPATREFLEHETGFELPKWTAQSAPVSYIVAEGFDPFPRAIVPSDCLVPTAGHRGGLTGTYFRGLNFDTPAVRRVDATIDFDWEHGPDPLAGRENYSVRWQGRLRAPESGAYTFYLTHDDGARLWVDNVLLVDDWSLFDTWTVARPLTKTTRTIELQAGREYNVQIEYYQKPGRGQLRLHWTTPALRAQATAAAAAVLQRVKDDGTTLIILDHAEGWGRFLGEADLLTYHGWIPGGLYWLGSNYFVRAHPLFADLPVNQGLNWEYQELARYEANRFGLLLDREEAVVGLVTGHQHAVATAVGVVRHGKGRIVLSTLDITRVLNAPPGPADVVRKLLCNFLAYSRQAD